VSAERFMDAGAASFLGGEAAPADCHACVGKPCPSDEQIATGWICECGHEWDPHEVDYDGRFVLGGCARCERNAQPTVLDVLIAREPLRAP